MHVCDVFVFGHGTEAQDGSVLFSVKLLACLPGGGLEKC